MGVNQVLYGDTTVMDITDSTVDTNNLLLGEIAYNAAGDRIVGTVDLNSKVNNSSVAPVETSPSTADYGIGDEFIWNGTLYKVISPIAIGDELVVDENIEVDIDILTQIHKNKLVIINSKNSSAYTIQDEQEVKIANFTFKTYIPTVVQVHLEVNLETSAGSPSGDITSFSDVWTSIANAAVKGKITYVYNEEEITDFYPTESWIDGKHILHLMYTLEVEEPDVLNYFDVYMEADGGTITIAQNGLRLVAFGSGLMEVEPFDGNLEVSDIVADWDFMELEFNEEISDTVGSSSQIPVPITCTDNVTDWDFIELAFNENLTDTVSLIRTSFSVERTMEDGTSRTMEDGTSRYTEGE